MSRLNPWASIGVGTEKQLSVLRSDSASRHDFFWARNQSGEYVFLYKPNTDFDGRIEIPALRGITARYYAEGRQLQLVLQHKDDWELFLTLCDDLMRSAKDCTTSAQVIERLVTRLGEWQRFLSKKPQKILDEIAIRGLIGELAYLHEVLLPRYGAASITLWNGPNAKQDFTIGTTLVEVKTYLAGGAPKVVISSPEQLWSTTDALYLAVTCLAKVPVGTRDAINLPTLVSRLKEAVHGTPYHLALEEKLDDRGYIDLPDYADHAYRLATFRTFEVRHGFPRLLPSAIPDGVLDVSYSIHLDRCMPFEASPAWPAL